MSRLKKLESLFHQALELEDELRLEFLKRECGNDKGLLDELCALLESDSSNDNFMEEPAMAVHAGELSMISPHITEGSVIGRHRLLSPIGIGGMGSVYKACDTRSGRIEAVKILAPDLASTRSAVRRFFREAKTVAAYWAHTRRRGCGRTGGSYGRGPIIPPVGPSSGTSRD